MIEQMSPLTRRIVAVGLAVLLILIAIQYAIVPLAIGIGERRDELASLQTREARLRATIRRPLPKASSVPPAQTVNAANAMHATQRLQALLAGDAALAGVTLQLGAPCASKTSPTLLCVQIAVLGPEAGVSHFLSQIEHGAPAIRFQSWQLAAGQGSDNQLHMTAQARAAWRSPS